MEDEKTNPLAVLVWIFGSFLLGAILLFVLAVCGGCGATFNTNHPNQITLAPNSPEWVEKAMLSAGDFWFRKGVVFNLYEPADYQVIVIDLKKDNNIGECGWGMLMLDPTLENRADVATCVLAHEMGHSIGMNHVEQSLSLMAPVVRPDPHGDCFWSDLDERELKHALQFQPKVCP